MPRLSSARKKTSKLRNKRKKISSNIKKRRKQLAKYRHIKNTRII